MIHAIHNTNKLNTDCQEITSRPIRYAVLDRLSEAEKGDGSIRTHVEAIVRRIESEIAAGGGLGVIVKPYYIDDGVSGRTDQRPALQRLMADAIDDMWDVVVCWKFDRFMRNNTKSTVYVDRFHQLGKAIVSLDGVDTRNEAFGGKVLRGLLSLLAESESDNISQRIKARRARDRAEQKWTAGKVIYGYLYNSKTRSFEIIESEAAVIKLIYQLRVDDYGVEKIERYLNEHGYRTRPTKRKGEEAAIPHYWHISIIRDILRNPVYMGKHQVGFEVPAIIDEVTWYTAQRKLDEGRKMRTGKTPTWLQGAVVCGECGYRYRIQQQVKGYTYLQCYGRHIRAHPDNSPRCRSPRFRLDWLEKVIEPVIIKGLSDKDGLLRAVEDAKTKLLETQRRLGDTKSIESELTFLELSMERLQRERVEGRMPESRWKAWYADYEQKKAKLGRRIADIDPASRAESREIQSTIDTIESYLAGDNYKFVVGPLTGISVEGEDGKAVSLGHSALLDSPKHLKTSADSFNTQKIMEMAVLDAEEGYPAGSTRKLYKQKWMRQIIKQFNIKVMVYQDYLEVTGAIPSQYVSFMPSANGIDNRNIKTSVPFLFTILQIQQRKSKTGAEVAGC